MELMKLMERSLFDVRHDQKVLLEWRRRVEMAQGIPSGLSYIHAQGAVHRDIKSPNILVREKEVKIAAWLAPELFNNAQSTPKVDLYAFVPCTNVVLP